MEQTALQWISEYGAPALFGLLVFGIVGLPVPDETLLALAGVFVRRGELSLMPTALAAAAGTATGITISYALGRFLGLPVLHRFGRYVRVSDAGIEQVHDWFSRLGGWALTFGYFVPGLRHLVAVVAGSSGLEAPPFAMYAYGGAVLWVATFLSLGYFLGDEFRPAVESIRRHALYGAGVLAVATLVYSAFRWRRR
jgi:membrane protein DedA with SNARE-associated domain